MRSADARIVIDLADYLSALGLGGHAQALDAPACDICGCPDAVQVRDTVSVTATLATRFATLCCARCGLLYQAPRFPAAFYRAYYAQTYRHMLGGAPSADYVADQAARGAALLGAIADRLPQGRRLLDVGCGVGAMMMPFIAAGWTAQGIDPDEAAVLHGAERLGLPVVLGDAEAMTIAPGAFDLILIAGSLEHVHDPGAVLTRCHRAAAPGSLLLLEAHGLGQAAHAGAIGHNHRRLLTGTTMALLMLRHGWRVEWVTEHPLCGPTRPGSVFALGRKAEPAPLDAAILGGLRDVPATMAALLDDLGIG